MKKFYLRGCNSMARLHCNPQVENIGLGGRTVQWKQEKEGRRITDQVFPNGLPKTAKCVMMERTGELLSVDKENRNAKNRHEGGKEYTL